MKYTTVKFSELDSRCLLAQRYLHQCHTCEKYHKCKYKTANRRADRLMRKRRSLLDKVRDITKEIQELDSKGDQNGIRRILNKRWL